MITSFDRLWHKLAKSKKYREQFVSAQAKRAFPFQVRSIMRKRGLSQEKLAAQSNLTQGVISRAVDPNYGNLTINTIVKIAGGLDMAYLGILVPFSELAKWIVNLSEEGVQVSTFHEEGERVDAPTFGASTSVPEKKAVPRKQWETGQQLAAMGKEKTLQEIRDNASENAKELVSSLVESGGRRKNEIRLDPSR